MKRVSLILLCCTILWSCEKKNITGTVKDNLGNPLENIQVSVKNTDFKAQTNSNGNFSLEYAPGEIDLIIEEDGYTIFEKHYVIYERALYPLGEIGLVKIPQNKGLFLISSNKYSEVSNFTMSSTDKEKGKGWSTKLDVSYYLVKDSIFTFESSDDMKVRFLDYTGLTLKLVKVDSLFKVANYEIGMSSYKVQTNYHDEEVKQISEDMCERTFTVEKGQVYAFLNIVDYYANTQKMSDKAFAFKFE